jgi:pyruvate dehydrogenase E2 component (dihydrolipoamide acetyltransferase)
MHAIIMPKLGLDMESGIIEKWHVQEGDEVQAGDVLFEVGTDKATLEVESEVAGVVRKLLFGEGEEIAVSRAVAYVGGADEAFPDAESSDVSADTLDLKNAGGAAEKAQVVSSGETETQPGTPVPSGGRMAVSPLARRLAREAGLALAGLSGTGPGGRIVKRDIEALKGVGPQGIEKGTTGPKIAYSQPLRGMRKVIAERMSRSKREIPHMQLQVTADVTGLVEWRSKQKEKSPQEPLMKVSVTDFLIAACAVALVEHPLVNASLEGETLTVFEDVNIGVAVALEDGLVVPVLTGCQKLSLTGIAERRSRLVEKARKGALLPDEMRNGTFTFTNLGSLGMRSGSAIINPPQAAILAAGTVCQVPAVVNGEIAIRFQMELCVSCDHRIIDGALGARFLSRIAALLEAPGLLTSCPSL